jgi:hypothetical protein
MKARRKAMLVVTGAAAALAIGSIAWAAVPDGNGVIHGCYDKQSGGVRVTDTATNQPKPCTAKEAPLDWNQQGPQGIQGVPGPQGPQGDPGPSGTMVFPRHQNVPVAVSIQTTVGAFGIPLGWTNVLVTAKLVIGTTDSFGVPFCSLVGYPGGILLDQSRATISAPVGASMTTLYLTGAAKSLGAVDVVCTAPNGFARDLVLTETKVGSIVTQ